MHTNSEICIDASFALKLVLFEPGSEEAHDLWEGWLRSDLVVIAPLLLFFEATSVIRNHVHRELISEETGRRALEVLHGLSIGAVHSEELHLRAWEFATHFDRPTAYDSYYLAMANAAGCDLWTADRRLYNAVREELSWVKCLGI